MICVIQTVEGDGPAFALPSTGFVPELLIRFFADEFGVGVIRDNAHEGTDFVAVENRFDPGPTLAVVGRAGIVEPYEVLFRHIIVLCPTTSEVAV